MNKEELILLNEILEGKEKRALIQRELLHRYNKILISCTLNIPGIYKVNKLYKKAHTVEVAALEKELGNRNIEIVYKKYNVSKAGYETFLVVNSDLKCVKEATIFVEENNQLGRLFDLDVFDKEQNQLSRCDLGYSKRKCLICNEDAVVCSRNKAHSIEEVLEKIERLIKNY
ncbi:MAG: citrate lyase holo-[acyl-carrier protein] synthase [Clostridium perfringens]|nr:citrate lyase holo-[acyl-carrier protein] synthase [Clostridium perfringens]